jgi:TolB-like protein
MSMSLAVVLVLVAAPSLPKLAVMPLQPLNGVKVDVARMLTETFTTEAGKLGQYEVVSADEVQDLLGLEKLKDAIGCDDVSCSADIAGGLGADFMVSGSVGKLASELKLSLKLFDAKSRRVVQRIQRGVKDDEANYERAVIEAARELFGAAGTPTTAKALQTPGPAMDGRAKAAPRPVAVTSVAEAGITFTVQKCTRSSGGVVICVLGVRSNVDQNAGIYGAESLSSVDDQGMIHHAQRASLGGTETRSSYIRVPLVAGVDVPLLFTFESVAPEVHVLARLYVKLDDVKVTLRNLPLEGPDSAFKDPPQPPLVVASASEDGVTFEAHPCSRSGSGTLVCSVYVRSRMDRVAELYGAENLSVVDDQGFIHAAQHASLGGSETRSSYIWAPLVADLGIPLVFRFEGVAPDVHGLARMYIKLGNLKATLKDISIEGEPNPILPKPTRALLARDEVSGISFAAWECTRSSSGPVDCTVAVRSKVDQMGELYGAESVFCVDDQGIRHVAQRALLGGTETRGSYITSPLVANLDVPLSFRFGDVGTEAQRLTRLQIKLGSIKSTLKDIPISGGDTASIGSGSKVAKALARVEESGLLFQVYRCARKSDGAVLCETSVRSRTDGSADLYGPERLVAVDEKGVRHMAQNAAFGGTGTRGSYVSATLVANVDIPLSFTFEGVTPDARSLSRIYIELGKVKATFKSVAIED